MTEMAWKRGVLCAVLLCMTSVKAGARDIDDSMNHPQIAHSHTRGQ